ncbi:MAG TPA: hypothetical protein VKB77_01155 [Terriglobales bacterium]|nr:hypothetical protein [Terriglobales bacterium]
MTYLALILLLASCGLAQTASPPANGPSPAIPVDQANARKARAILDQAIQALGGPAYLNIQDISQEGRTYSFHLGQPTSAGALFWRFYRYPDKDRIELTKKRDVAYVYTGDNGYEITYKGTRSDEPKAVADYLRRRHFALDWVLRHWINDPGVAFFYEGQAVADQKNCDQVTVMNNHGEAVTLYIDLETHLPVKKTFYWRDPNDKQRNAEDETYDAYREQQGIMTPYTITRYYNGDMSNQRFLSSVAYNKNLSDSLFNASITYDPNKR